MIEKARSRSKARFFVMDLTEIEFDDEFFDGVWCQAVLLYIPKKELPKVLNGINRVLKIGGMLFIGLKEGEGEGMIKDERYDYAEKYHAYFTYEEIKGILEKAGFEVIEHDIHVRDVDYLKRSVMSILAKKITP